MPRHHTDFEDFSLIRELGEALRAQHTLLREPLPGAWLELLAKLDEPPADGEASTPSPPTQPKQSEDDDSD